MRRGEIWTVATAGPYARKPRPAVIVQSDAFDGTQSVTLCGLTTIEAPAGMIRVSINPTPENGLRLPCFIMADKIMTVERFKLGRHVGALTMSDMVRLDAALIVFLGLGGRSSGPGA